MWERAQRELDLVLEITERAVTARPAELVRVVGDARSAGHGIALDDVGADVRSLALLPLVEPDIIKLDLRLVQDRPSTDQAAIVSAVAAERERTGAQILAEGIETEAHVTIARSLGATLGQGWHFGRPGPLVAPLPIARVRRHTATAPELPGSTPFEVVAAVRSTGEATKRLLLPMSHHLEERALRIGEGAVILSAFQEARHFTKATVRRYEALARRASLVAAFGVGLADEPVHGVRGAQLDPDDVLAGEWSVIVLGPHFAGALVGRDLGDVDRPDGERRFAFATVYERGARHRGGADVVVADRAARAGASAARGHSGGAERQPQPSPPSGSAHAGGPSRYHRGEVVGGGVSAARATSSDGAGSARCSPSAAAKSSPTPSTALARTPNAPASATKSGVSRSTPNGSRPTPAPGRTAASRSRRHRRPPPSAATAPACAVASSPHANRKPPSPQTASVGPAAAAPSAAGKA